MGALVRLLACVAILAVAGCGLLPDVVDETANLNAERIYKLAHDAMIEGNYTRAIKLFETLEARFPYGRYAQQAILELAFANYRAGETAAAIAACDRFIRTFPNHPNVDYAYYLKGLVTSARTRDCSATCTSSTSPSASPRGCASRSPRSRSSSPSFRTASTAQDATDRMRYLTNALAKYEVNVARYYYNRGAYVAATNRAQAAIVDYPQTPANEEALDVLAQELRQARTAAARATTRSAILRADLSGQHLPRRRRRNPGGSSGSTRRGESRRAGVADVGIARAAVLAGCLRSWSPRALTPRAIRSARYSLPCAKNASTSFNSRVRRIGGRLCQIRLP